MKKLLCAVIALLLVFALISCDTDSNGDQDNTKADNTQSVTTGSENKEPIEDDLDDEDSWSKDY